MFQNHPGELALTQGVLKVIQPNSILVQTLTRLTLFTEKVMAKYALFTS